MRRSLYVPLVLSFLAQVAQGQGREKDADFWLMRAMGKVAMSETAEWDASMEVIKAPGKQERAKLRGPFKDSKYPLMLGTTDYHFRVKGKAAAQKDYAQAFSDLQSTGDPLLYWDEKVRGRVEKPARQVWSKGDAFLMRSSGAPSKLVSIKVFKGDGLIDGVRQRFLGGGILGWRLGSGIDNETSYPQYASIFVASSPKWVKEETIAGRRAVVLDVTIGVVACRFYPMGIGRIWIDSETHLMIQRRTTLNLDMDEPIWIVNEVYSNWRLNQPIADVEFLPPAK